MNEPDDRLRRLRPLLPALFLVTGAAGLVYEVVWFKLLDAIFGVTALATSTVLAVFMGGLGLGAALAARRADRWERPLFAYGVLETVLGAFAAIVPFLLPLVNRLFVGAYDAMQPSLATLSLLRAIVCALVLLPPATLMGMTLPVVARAFSRDESAAPDVGLLYTINTLGAAAGAALAGFVLLPALGLARASLVAVSLNVGVGVAAMILGRGLRLPPAPAAAPSAAPATAALPPSRLLLAISAISGLTSLGYQVFWTRALVLAFGNTAYAFSAILVTVLAGIAAGSAVATLLLRRTRHAARILAVTQLLAAAVVASLLAVFDALPAAFADLSARWSGSFAGYVGATFVLAFGTLLPAALLLGMGLPLVLGSVVAGTRGIARDVGSVYAVNTFGAIAGAIAAGFLVLPLAGVRGGVLLFATANAGAAALAALVAWPGARARLVAGAAAAAVVAASAAFTPAWNAAVMTKGGFGGRASSPPGHGGDGDLVYYRDGVVATVSVRRRGSDFQLQVDGRTEATAGDFKTNTFLGSLPAVLHPRPERALVIGLGSGVTVAGVLRLPVQEVECIELSPEVVEAARFFAAWQDGALDDPRVTLRASDGRNHLLLTRATYDLILSQPSNVWAAGMGSLFTREFFELCADRLADDGILCQWIQAYAVSKLSLKSVLRTIAEVFPSVDVWVAEWSDVLVIASRTAAPIDAARLEAVLADPRAGDGFRRAGVPDLPTLLSHWMLEDDAVRRFSRNAPIHTDDDRRLELQEPRSLARGNVSVQANTLLAWQGDVRARLTGWPPAGATRDEAERALEAAVRARQLEIRARTLESAGRGREAVETFAQALDANPADGAIRRNFAQLRLRIGVDLARRGELHAAWSQFVEAARTDPACHDAWANLGVVERLSGRPPAALEATRRAAELDPANERYATQEGDILRDMRRWPEAIAAYRRALAVRPGFPAALLGVAECLARSGGAAEARRVLDEARAAGAGEAELERIAGLISGS